VSIQVKDYKVLKGILQVPFHSKLIALAMWISVRYSQVVFTSSYREKDKGVHGQTPCRGLDIRSRVFPDPDRVTRDINSHWLYDVDRLHLRCALLHGEDLGEHIHLQVHDKTKYLGGKKP